MQETTKQWLQKWSTLRVQRRRAYASLTALAILVSLSTSYLLVRPASTMEAELVCGLEEHVHTEACYAEVLICGAAEVPEESSGQTQPPPQEELPPTQGESLEEPPPSEGSSVAESPSGEEMPGNGVPEDVGSGDPPTEEDPSAEAPPPDENAVSEEGISPEEAVSPTEPNSPPETAPPVESPLPEPPQSEDTPEETPSDDIPPVESNSPEAAPSTESQNAETEGAEFASEAENTQMRGAIGGVLVHYIAADENAASAPSAAAPEPAGEEAPQEVTSPGTSGPTASKEENAAAVPTEVPAAPAPPTDGESTEKPETPAVTETTEPTAPVEHPEPAEDSDTPADAEDPAAPELPEAQEPPAENEGTGGNPADAPPEIIAFPEQQDAPEESGGESHTHTEACYARKLICGKEEHTHDETCRADYRKQGTMMMVLPQGATIPVGYESEYSYIDSENRFGVLVYAPENALPEGAILTAQLLEEDSDAYAAAEDALASMAAETSDEEPFTYDGFVALDICFLLEGAEVEPALPVYVCIHAAGLLPENADPDSISVQHHAETEQTLLGVIPVRTEISVDVVADRVEDIGALETTERTDTAAVDVMAAFAVESFSTFTATYSLLPIPSDGWDGWRTNDFYTFEVDAVNHYEDGVDTILFYGGGSSVSASGYFPADMDWSNWYGIRVENRQGRYQVIQRVVHERYAAGSAAMPSSTIHAMGTQNADGFILLIKGSTPILPYDAAAYDTTPFMTNADASDDNGAYITVDGVNKYKPAAHWPEGSGADHTLSGSGDSAVLALDAAYSEGDAWKTMQDTVPAGTVQVALYPAQWPDYLTNGAPDTVETVEGNDAIGFQLFDYSPYINKTAADDTAGGWRDISAYFQFRGEEGVTNTQVRSDLPNGNRDNAHDEDGFTKHHTTVERQLDENGYPVLDLTRNADGTSRTDSGGNALSPDALLNASQRSMAYLFQSGDHAVTAYAPSNTILRYDEASGTYRYDSRENAVDYDAEENRFYVRNYVECNDDTAASDQGSAPYYDFLPFDHTGGLETGTTADGYGYQLDSSDVDYWFGMRMDVDFYQGKDGQYKGSDMVFNFSGDDDVWVFLDGVLVLDLGGTHGMVSGSINFATGEVEQYLDWNGTTAVSGSDHYFATTIQQCFDAAGATPNNGWKNYDAETNSGTFADYTPHTLSFFYLERGSSVANCMIDFNLPTVPEQSLTVTKNVEDPGDAIADDTLYTFRVLKETGDPFVEQGDTYTLLENDIVQGTRTVTAEDGSFHLAAGQSARFMQTLQLQPGVTTYLVEELLPNGEKLRYSTVAYQAGAASGSYAADTEGIAGETDTAYPTPVLSAESTQMVIFTNTVKPGDLTLRKVVYRTDGMDAAPAAFTFALTGPAGTYLTDTGESITLAENEPTQVTVTTDTPLTIFGLPAGCAVSVSEPDHDGFAVRWKHDNATAEASDDVEVLSDAISGVPIGIGSTTTLTCTNTTGAILPSTGGTGTSIYTVSGITLLLGASLLLVQRHRKRVFGEA